MGWCWGREGKGIPCSERREQQEREAFHSEVTFETTALMEKLYIDHQIKIGWKNTHKMKHCDISNGPNTYIVEN